MRLPASRFFCGWEYHSSLFRAGNKSFWSELQHAKRGTQSRDTNACPSAVVSLCLPFARLEGESLSCIADGTTVFASTRGKLAFVNSSSSSATDLHYWTARLALARSVKEDTAKWRAARARDSRQSYYGWCADDDANSQCC